MALLNRVNWESNERVDIPDMRELTRSVAAHMEAVIAEVINANAENVISGFVTSLVDTTTIRVTRGTNGAFIGVDPETNVPGFLVNDAQGSAWVDFNFFGKGYDTYAVWVKANLTPGVEETRAFWDRGTNREFPDQMNVRQLVDWTVTTTVASGPGPGAEWIKVSEVVWNGSLIVSDITDARNLLFEGPIYEVMSQAGLADYDRSANRSSAHITRLRQFSAAVLREIQDIKSNYWNHDADAGGHAFFTDHASPTGLEPGLSLRSAQTPVVSVGDGTNSIGNYNADDPAYSGDASLAIQAAIDRCTQGGVVLIKPGLYTCATPLAFPATQTDQITIRGSGEDATILGWNAAPQAMFVAAPTVSQTKVEISDLTISYINGTSTSDMIRIDLGGLSTEDMDLVRIARVRFLATNGPINTGITVVNGSQTETLKRLYIEDCRFQDLEQCFQVSWISQALFVRGCSSEGTSSRIATITSCQGVAVSGCSFRGTDNNPILLVDGVSTQTSISDSVFYRSVINIYDSRRASISGCLVDANSATRAGILARDTDSVSILGNVVSSAASYGIVVSGTGQFTGASVEGNIVLSDKGGIWIAPPSGSFAYGVKVIGNVLAERLYGDGTAPAASAGIWVQETRSPIVSANMIFRVGRTGIYLTNCPNAVVEGNSIIDDDIAGGQDVTDRIVDQWECRSWHEEHRHHRDRQFVRIGSQQQRRCRDQRQHRWWLQTGRVGPVDLEQLCQGL
jgi:parallel beta-helix repeat protein